MSNQVQRKVGDLQVWWCPQIPMQQHFRVDVATVEEGVKIMEVLANYDLFQFENKVKPDYSNMGGLEVWSEDCDGEGNAGWNSWYDEETGEDDPFAFLIERALVDASTSDIQYRPQRGGFEESMAEVRSVMDLNSLAECISAQISKTVSPSQLSFNQIGLDDRNGWNTHIVIVDGLGAVGFTNGTFT